MKRKLLIVSVLASAVLGLASCGSKPADSAESVATVQNAGETETAKSEEIEQQSETAAEEASTEIVTEEAASNEQDSSEVIWYMDSEGLKSDELGIVIRKDNDSDQKIEMSCDTDSQYDWLYCDYYNGDIDTYISESAFLSTLSSYSIMYMDKSDMKKASIDNVEYAYVLGNHGSALVVFVGNGIAISTEIYQGEETVEEHMKSIWNKEEVFEKIKVCSCDEFQMDCMAYMTDDGIYSPALGIKFNIDEGMYLRTSCRQVDKGQIDFSNKLSYYAEDAKDAQDAVEKYVKYYTDLSNTFQESNAGELETIDFGKYTYYGKGYTYNSGSVDKYFCSDDTEWNIDFNYVNGNEDYINCIESLE